MVAVKYKYPNEDEVIIQNADNYQILYSEKPTLWQAVGTYYDLRYEKTIVFVSYPLRKPSTNFAIKNQGEITLLGTSTSQERTLPRWGLEIGVNNNFGNPIYVPVTATFGSFPITLNSPIGFQLAYYLNPSTGIINNQFTPLGGGVYSVKMLTVLAFTVYDWQATNFTVEFFRIINYPAPTVTLRIYQGNNQVFTRTETYEPVYVEVINGCPEGTCPVLCNNGTQVCCYGSNGISVFSYQY